jgi:hypothetical protein
MNRLESAAFGVASDPDNPVTIAAPVTKTAVAIAAAYCARDINVTPRFCSLSGHTSTVLRLKN